MEFYFMFIKPVYFVVIILFSLLCILGIVFQTSPYDTHDFLFNEDIVAWVEGGDSEPVFTNALPIIPEKETDKAAEFAELDETKDSIIFIADVPFTAQAPLAEWSDPRQQDGCEETSVIMAMYWVKEEALSPNKAKEEILKISHWQEDNHQIYADTSARDTADWLIKEYFKHPLVEVKYDIRVADIINELKKGNLVLVPAQGQRLLNPNFTPPGPERHMVLVRGYDPNTAEFITNDPGTRRGEEYRYPADVLFNAIEDYPTGNHLPSTEIKKAMIVVVK